MKTQRKPEEKENSGRLLREAAGKSFAWFFGASPEMKEKNSEELLHELQVHQIELEMQNEELRKAQLSLEDSRQRYADLYDFAPVGYFTFTPEALIKEANLTVATLLGVARQKLINRRFRWFVAPSDFDLWDCHFLKVLKQGEKQTCDLTLKRQDGSTFQAGLESIRMEVSRGALEIHTAVTDITARKRAEEALRESGEHYRTLFDEALDGICLADAETGIIIDCNQALATLVGRERAELIGQSQKILHPPNHDQAIVSSTFKQHLTDKQGQILETQVVTRQGDIREVEIKANFLDIRGRKLLQGIFRDSTARKRAEETLRKSEARFINLFHTAAGGVFQATPEGRLIIVNRAFARMFGYESPEEVINTMTDITRQIYVNPDDSKMFIGIFKGKGPLRNYESQMRRKDGCIFWGSISVRFTENVDGIPCFEGLIVDVSERKRTEEELQKSQEKYRNIFENALEGIFQTTPEGRFLTVNPAMARMYGYDSPEELINSVTDLAGQTYVNPEQRREYLRTLEEKGEVKEFEVQLKRKDGTSFWASNNGRAVRDSTGKTLYYEGICEEITQRLESEGKLNETLENLRKAMGGIIQVISDTVETRDPYTAGHQRRVADLARAIAQEMGLADDRREGLRMAGTIHDLGKVSIPSEILSKPTKLSVIEYKLIQAHSQIGYDILKGIEFPWPISDMVLQHHERMNGSGYPQGLKGEAISLEARILMVADVVEAMASYRPYRPALGVDAALEEIEKNKGILYDPEVVELCLKLFKEKGFRFA